MSPTDFIEWAKTTRGLERFGQVKGQPSGTPFILRTTEPTLANTGYLADPDYDPAEPLIPYTGAGAGGVLTTSVNGEEFHNIDFGTTLVTFRGQQQKLKRCRIRNTATRENTLGSQRGGVNVNDDTQSGAIIQYTTIQNTVRTVTASNAIQGHDFSTFRNQYEGWIDGVGIWHAQQSPAWDPVNVLLQGDYFGPMMYLRASTTGVVHPSDTDTHNDQVQIHQGSNISVIGCALHCRYATTHGDYGNVDTGAGRGGVTMTFAVGEAYRVFVEDNWVYGGRGPFNFGTNPINSARYDLGSIVRNKFDGTHDADVFAIGIDPLWTGDFGVGVPEKMNTYMDPATHERDLARPVTVSRSA